MTFFDGYCTKRAPSEADLSLIDTFVIVRELAKLAFGNRHINDFGHNDILASHADHVCDRLNRFSAKL